MKRIYTSLVLLLVCSCAFAQIEGTWQIAPEGGSLAVGPAEGDFSWWSIGDADVTTRACLYDDQYVFNADGSFENVVGAETWLEGWQGQDPEGCGAPVAPHDGSGDATWAYDADAGTVTLTGTGAYLGLAKVHNGGELGAPSEAPASISYPAVLSEDGNTMTIDINFGGIGFWHFVMTKTAGSTSVFNQVENTDLFDFYPNPASTEVQVVSTQANDVMIVRDITGQEVMVKNAPAMNETLSVGALPRGLYLLECRSANQVSVKKLMLK